MRKEIPNSFQKFKNSDLAQENGRITFKKFQEVGGFPKILRNFQTGSWQILTSDYKVGGWGEKRPKTCLRNT